MPNQNSRTDRLQSLSPIRLLCRPSPKVSVFLLRNANFQILIRFSITFSFLKKRLNFRSPKSHQNLNNLILERFGLRCWLLLVPFWQPFSKYFMTPRALQFCNMSPAKRSLLPFKPSHFGIKNQSKTQFVSHTFLGPPFSCFLIFLQKMSIWGPPPKSSGRQNRFQNRPLAPKNTKKTSVRLIVAGPGSGICESIPIDFGWILADL